MPDYSVKTEGFILGTYRQKRETVALTEAQAKTFVREGRIEPKEEPRRTAPKSETKAS